MEILKKNQKQILDIKNTTDANAFDGLINRLDTADERISELEDITIETSESEKQKKKKTLKQKIKQNNQKLWDNKWCNICIMKMPDEKENKIFEQ